LSETKQKSFINRRIAETIRAHGEVICSVMHERGLIAAWVSEAIKAYRRGGKIVFFGNGGSAADAQHWAVELVCRYKKDRKSLAAIALTTDTSAITAIGNDFGFDGVFSRQVEGLVGPKDLVVGISTSGNSENVLQAVSAARRIGAYTVGLTGMNDTKLCRRTDLCIKVQSTETGRIQEAHGLIGHIFCEMVEEILF
jgi:D-sedoheptulose 7-phosphate isomerase